MSDYFKHYPQTPYKFANSSFSIAKSVTNISLKTAITSFLPQDDPYLFLKYTIKENEKAEEIADFYYDDPGFVWLIYFANNIIDPYTQWPKSYEQFTAYFRKKYVGQAQPVGTDPVIWGQNTLRTDNIVHWKNNDDETLLISPDSYTRAQTFNNDFVAGDWTAVRYFDYEMEENEEMRTIWLVNEIYAQTAKENLIRLVNG